MMVVHPTGRCKTCGEPLKFVPCLNDHTHLTQERDER